MRGVAGLIAVSGFSLLSACSYVDPVTEGLGLYEVTFSAFSLSQFGLGVEETAEGVEAVLRADKPKSPDGEDRTDFQGMGLPKGGEGVVQPAVPDKPINLLEGVEDKAARKADPDLLSPSPVGNIDIAGLTVGGMLALAEDELLARGYEAVGIGTFLRGPETFRINAAHPNESASVLDLSREMRFETLEEARAAAQNLCEMTGAVLGIRPISVQTPILEETCSFLTGAGGYWVTVSASGSFAVHESLGVINVSI